MLSVRSSEEKIKPLLPAGVSFAVMNAPGVSVVSGPDKEVADFSASLTALGIANKLLQTSHAFHSAMMDPILSSFEEIASSIKMNMPEIPIVSTLTGKWAVGDEMSRPSYWVRQLREPVRFSEAMKTISERNLVLLETGPGKVLTSLIRHQGFKKLPIAIASLGGEEGRSDRFSFLQATGQLWLHGIDIDWKEYSYGRKNKKINLPAYAFDRVRCWVDPVISPYQVSDQPNLLPANNNTDTREEKTSFQVNRDRKSLLVERLKYVFENASGIEMEGIDFNTNFIEIGFDSLLLTQVALNLKKEFGLSINFRQLNETFSSLDALADYLDAQLPVEKFREEQKHEISEDSSISNLSKQLEQLAQQVANLQSNRSMKHDNRSASITQPPASNQQILTKEEIAELKKPFGATARIDKNSSALTKKQQAFLEDLTRRYNQKTKLSKASAQQHRLYMADPRVVY
jgi:acyl transferase domain-containing protein